MIESKILQLLKKHNLRHTEKRERLIKIFKESEKEFELIEVIQEMRRQFPNVRQQTVVSNLDALVKAGLLVKTQYYSEVTFCFSEKMIS
ncbi:transcriptional repressor [Brevibacillus sp. SYSU BS000544]|uniref:transcriptional repressor n=1 Tax=Brevibacillus sp. SYSU BS000544 TaxID=3416443 RepID=UPI003CE5A19B